MKIRVGIALACTLFVSGGVAAAEELRASVGALAGVSLRVQPARSPGAESLINYLASAVDSDFDFSYKKTWTTIGGTLFLDAIFGYLDVSIAGVVGTVRTDEKKGLREPISYWNDRSSIGVPNLTLTVGLGVKVPIVISDYVTLFPFFGIDLLFGKVSNMSLRGTPFRIGAGGDFSFDKNWFVRTTIDYAWTPDFTFTNFKAGIGTKL